jgi:2-polyprenyl-3-methyl-5-hydroxy-6-metoxy-1,4-benzoquinol methylase
MDMVVLISPASILDVGVGFGKYGFLSREFLEVRDSKAEYGKWKRTIDGIEAYEGYLTPMHEHIYDEILIGNAIELLPKMKKDYDLILLIDVLEHLHRHEGEKLLDECIGRSGHVIVSTPKVIGGQTDSHDNPYETHRSQWTKADFARFPSKFFVPNFNSIICYIGGDAVRLRGALRRSRVGTAITNLLPFLSPSGKRGR